MDRQFVGVSESDDLVETVELLLREGADTAVVLRGRTPVGVLTDRDVLALLVDGPEPEDATVADAMSPRIPTVDATETLPAAADRMSARDARRLVVTEPTGDEPLGIITEHDLLATSTHGTAGAGANRAAGVAPGDEIEGGVATALATESETDAADSFQNQGICERCGTFSRDLVGFNGQLLCSDCRDV
jgi:CBS domain containing-hemolysin-like protein